MPWLAAIIPAVAGAAGGTAAGTGAAAAGTAAAAGAGTAAGLGAGTAAGLGAGAGAGLGAGAGAGLGAGAAGTAAGLGAAAPAAAGGLGGAAGGLGTLGGVGGMTGANASTIAVPALSSGIAPGTLGIGATAPSAGGGGFLSSFGNGLQQAGQFAQDAQPYMQMLQQGRDALKQDSPGLPPLQFPGGNMVPIPMDSDRDAFLRAFNLQG